MKLRHTLTRATYWQFAWMKTSVFNHVLINKIQWTKEPWKCPYLFIFIYQWIPYKPGNGEKKELNQTNTCCGHLFPLNVQQLYTSWLFQVSLRNCYSFLRLCDKGFEGSIPSVSGLVALSSQTSSLCFQIFFNCHYCRTISETNQIAAQKHSLLWS